MTTQRSSPPTAVDAYLAAVPFPFRRQLEHLRKIIRGVAPDAEEVLSYRMPAFRYHGMLVYYAAFQDHCSFFVGSASARREFADELKPFEAGKGTLHFTPDHPLPDALVKRIVRARVAENLARRSSPSRSSLR